MHIVVPIKQVPETSNVQMDRETGTMIRIGSESIVNPLDLYALESALQIKDRIGATITAVTMGPPSSIKVLKEAIAMGCDAAVQLSDRKFGGADTWATSYTIASAIKRLFPVDLIIAGERATDGDTGQVGPGIASWLDMSVVSYVAHLGRITDKTIQVDRLIEEGYQKVEASLPAVLTVVKEVAIPRLPTLRGKKRAMAMDIPVWGVDHLEVNMEFIGLKGSPTKVVKIATPTVTRSCTVVRAEDDQSVREAVDKLLAYLGEQDLLRKGM